MFVSADNIVVGRLEPRSLIDHNSCLREQWKFISLKGKYDAFTILK